MDQGTAKSSKASSDGKKSPRALKTFGRYEIEKVLGQGGMGTVYQARDTKLKRIVALKVLAEDKAKNPILVRRFKSEAEAAAQLKHENLVGVHDSGEAEGLLYIAMEFVDGVDGQDLVLRDGLLEVERSLHLIKQVVQALRHAFEKNIVHRDIKPSNLLITADDHVKLADFGLARSLDETESASITRAGTTVGTVDYMPPEQARDSKLADFRSDLYSLGATWYFLLVGKPPFPDGDILNKLNAHANDPPPDPRKYNSDIPVAVVDVIHKLLAKAPGDRYQTPDELHEDLERLNLQQREITSSLIASLAAEDDSDDEPASKSKGKSRPREDEPQRPLRSPSRQGRAAPVAKAERPAKIAEEPAAPARRAPKRAAEETRSERDSKTSSAPVARATAARETADSGRTLRRGRHLQSARVSFDTKKLISMGLGVVGLIVALIVGRSLYKQAQATLNQPSVPPVVIPSDNVPSNEPLKRSTPQKRG